MTTKLISTETKFTYESERFKLEVEKIDKDEPHISLREKDSTEWDKQFLDVDLDELEAIKEKVEICIETIKKHL